MKFTPAPVYAFTQSFPGITNVLISDILITEAFDLTSGLPAPTGHPYKGLWDTGASSSVINSRIITELNLKPSGQTKVQAVGDGGKVNEYLTDTYSINIVLPNRVTMMGVVAAKGEISGADALIGMDVIGSGDFVVTNANGMTKLSFRTPSVEEIDFVKDIDEYKRKHGQRVVLSDDEKRRARNRRKHENRKRR